VARKKFYTVYTIGHSNLSLAELCERLKSRQIKFLVDVRTYPYSAHADWFNRDKIESPLRKEGIEYLYLGSMLGALTEDGRFDFVSREKDPKYQEGIKRLLELAQNFRVAVMSSEADFQVSHRHHLIAQTLLKLSVEVIHITETNQEEPAQPDIFHALLEEAPLFEESHYYDEQLI